MRPLLYREWDDLARFAVAVLRGRREGFPNLIIEGKITREEADHGIAVAVALAEIWRAAVECRLPDPDKVAAIDDTDICLDLIAALDRTNRLIFRQPGNSLHLRQKDRLEALIWWHRERRQGPISCVRGTHELRRQTAAQSPRTQAA